MISIILVALAAICNAVMDVISFHYKQSIFSRYNPQWWNPAISWKNKYIDWDNDVRMEKRISIGNIFSIKYPTFLTDAWHFFKSSMLALLGLAIILYKPCVNPFVDGVIIGLAWNLIFNVFYNKVFKKH